MRLPFFTMLLCFASLFMQIPFATAQENTMQIVLAAEMPNIAEPAQTRYAELKQLILNERKRVPTTFFIFGGGSVGPSALSNLDRGSHIIDILNSLEPDAMGVAKREFSYLVDELSLRSYEAAFPIVASNLIDTRLNTIPSGLAKTALITRNNIQLGFISISDQRLIKEYLLDNIEVLDKEVTLRALAKALRDEGADLILLHYFDEFPGLVSLLDEGVVNYAFNSNTRVEGSIYPEYLQDQRIFTLDAAASAVVASIGASDDFPLMSVKQHDLTKIPAELGVESQISDYLHRLNRLLDDNIAYWAGEYSTRRNDVRGKENAFANFVVDTMRDFGKADIAIINGGSIRGDTVYQKNTQITRRTIATELPFRATLTVISVSGQQVLEALEQGLSGLDLLRGTFPQVSGMRVKFDSTAQAGSRVQSVYIGDKKLDPAKQYILATTDYLAAGGDGYSALKTGDRAEDSTLERSILVSDLIQQTLSAKGKLDSKIDKRLVNVGGTP
jgi:2',3'-cyclic-nucleotide 2'-phosphodiesterase (5'-nucleotidase family)